MKFIVSLLIGLPLLLPRAAEQAPAAPAAQASSADSGIVGDWKVDRRQFADEPDVWRRRVDALPNEQGPATGRQTALITPDPLLAAPVKAGSGLDLALLRTAMRDLLETAESLSFQVKGNSVTITDDLKRAVTYATTGEKEKRQLAATRFDVKTRWNGRALTQELTAWTFGMTEVYLPRDDGQELLVSIKIDKPQFSPPIKDIARVYTKVK